MNAKDLFNLTKEVWIGWTASLVEAYNMAIYSFIAPFMAFFLFQEQTEWDAVFFSYALILIGSSVLYPLGAIYYGSIGDRKGRQKACIYSILGLGIATGMMGIIPYHGFADKTWILFLIFICGQYFFSGGEYYGSIVFSLEHAKVQSNGLMSALSCLFAVFGLAIANGMVTWLVASSDNLTTSCWGIRICFFLGGIGGILSYYLKNYCRETPDFVQSALGKNVSQKEFFFGGLFSQDWGKISRVVLVWGFFSVAYSFIFIFLPLVPFSQESIDKFDTFKSLIIYGVFLVLAGLLSDKIGIQKQILIGLLLFSLLIIPACYFISRLFYLQLILTPLACLVIAPIHSWMLTQFNVFERCRGMFISSAIAMIIFGGSAVPLCLKIYENTLSLTYCAFFPLILSLGAFTAVLVNLNRDLTGVLVRLAGAIRG